MFEKLIMQPADNIMALMGLFSSDKRENKIDLGVGVYKDRTGNTPIMGAVKAAEQQLLDSQASKSYVGLLGSLGFVDQIIVCTIYNLRALTTTHSVNEIRKFPTVFCDS